MKRAASEHGTANALIRILKNFLSQAQFTAAITVLQQLCRIYYV